MSRKRGGRKSDSQKRVILGVMELRGRVDPGLIKTKSDQIKSQLHRKGMTDIISHWSYDNHITLEGDPDTLIPVNVLSAIESDLKRSGINARVLYCAKPGTGRHDMRESLHAVLESHGERGIMIGQLTKELREVREEVRRAEENARTSQEGVQAVRKEREQMRMERDNITQEIGELRHQLSESEQRLSIDAEIPMDKQMDYLLLEGFSQREVGNKQRKGRAVLVAEEIEAEFREVMEKYSIGRDEVYRRIDEGLLEFEDIPDYDEISGEYKQAKEVLINREKLGKFVNVKGAEETVKKFEERKQKHKESKEITIRLVKPREIHYHMEAGESEKNYVINVLVPIKYSDKMTHTETYINGLIHNSWIEVNMQSMVGEFDRLVSEGITKYQFKVPKMKMKKEKMEELIGQFIRTVNEKQKDNPLYKTGVRFHIHELVHYRDDSSRVPTGRDTKHKEEDGEPIPLGYSLISEKYSSISERLRNVGFNSTGDPQEFLIRRTSDDNKTAIVRALMVLGATENISSGNEGISRRDIIRYVKSECPQHEIEYNHTFVESQLRALMTMGVLYRPQPDIPYFAVSRSHLLDMHLGEA